jgi:hypothetical protein
MSDEQQPNSDAFEMTSKTVAGDLISALVSELKLLPDIWPRIGPDEQESIIERVRKRVADNVRKAVHLIASEGRITVVGDLKKVTFGDKVEAVFSLSKNDPRTSELTHAQGQACVIVVASASSHMGGVNEEQAERQRTIPGLDGDDAASAIIQQAKRRASGKQDTPPPPPSDDDPDNPRDE